MPKSRFTWFRNCGSGSSRPRALKKPATSKHSRKVPVRRLASSNRGASVRPSRFSTRRLSSVAAAPSVAYRASAMPAAGQPCMVSRTWVLSPMRVGAESAGSWGSCRSSYAAKNCIHFGAPLPLTCAPPTCAGLRPPLAMIYDCTQAYPRDLIGYGPHPPPAPWPGGARIAVQFVLNYEEGGENAVLHGDAGSEQFLSEMFNPASYAGRHMSMEGIYEYGARAGVWRILREFEKRALPLTVFGVASALQRHPELARGLGRAGSGDRLPRPQVDPLPGHPARGRARAHGPGHGHHRAPDRHARAGLVHRARQPQHPPPGGRLWRLCLRQRLLRRCPAVLDEAQAHRRQRRAPAHRAVHPGLQRHALCAAPGLCVCRPVLPVPERQLRHAVRRRRPGRRQRPQDDEHRHALPPARPARAHHRLAALSRPPTAARQGLGGPAHRYRAPLASAAPLPRPCPRQGPEMMALTLEQLNRATPHQALQCLDGLYEHSPWVLGQALSERPFLSLAHLRHALAQVVRRAGADAQRGLIRAHPELAGPAMLAHSLSAASAREQTQAGLAQCSAEELARLRQLDADY